MSTPNSTTEPASLQHHPSTGTRWLRVALPALIIIIWLVGTGIGGPYFGRVEEVSSNNQAAYLPESADATRVQEQLGQFRDSTSIPAVVVIVGEERLTRDEIEKTRAAASTLSEIDGVGDGMSPLIASEDGRALEMFIPIDADAEIEEVVVKIGDHLRNDAPQTLTIHVTGPAGLSADLIKAFSGVDGLLLAVALIAVFAILIIVHRSVLLPVVVLATGIFALTVTLLTVWWLAKAGVLLLSGQTRGILFILVIGAATDYSLLYVARYREALRIKPDTWHASRIALRAAVEPILASGGTVIAGLLCLLLSDLKSNSGLGPVASIGIMFAMLSALTLLPAVLLLFGRAAFWPRFPHHEPDVAAAEHELPTPGVWGKVSSLIRRRPRQVWITTAILLGIGALGVAQLQADGVAQSDLVLTASQARDGQKALKEHFPGGSGSPLYVLTEENTLQQTANTVLSNPGIDSVSVLSRDSVSGSLPVTTEGIGTAGPPGTSAPAPTVVDGKVMLQATLSDVADSKAAEETVRDLRATFEQSETGALIGGVTATAIDTKDASIHDRTLIIPIVLGVILLILAMLLRSLLAPVLLIGTTVLSFGTALGVSAFVFNNILDLPGADPAVPLYGFVFLVALGIDYNIFLATRVREESFLHGTREGVLRGLAVTGGVITSAGLVLTATFSALAVIPILFLLQLAFIVAFGVLLDTFLVRALLVPALLHDIGPMIWWPSRLRHDPRNGATAS
ncbi:hypothetical protein HMPREF1531_01439 [Propionibacterium sp. oral taxon 192 str. F0372]|uniref:MMPL family transporter n=1 Tax=Propionibacterium sp. oral taxon 192 TaxID=671222 RepID=UPI000352BC08|nr:MMPL family transporter [Propionibacterium sp. oral taxon 192]EPH03380.1 hypothetical protein HMPREF1531_01439 [Propionibacterium sp. oral taxon 192 str. F0372]